MTPLLERQPGRESAPRAHADARPPPASGGANVTTAAPAARSRRRPGGGDAIGSAREVAAAEGDFVCRTCSRRFPSFQALGGHRTGHTRLLARHAMPPQPKPARATHECTVCGLEFAMGQALGGHMRRHKQQAEPPQALVEVEAEEEQPGEDKALDSICAPPTLEDLLGGGDREACSSASASEPRLLNLLV